MMKCFIIWYIDPSDQNYTFIDTYAEDISCAIWDFCELGHSATEITSIYTPIEERMGRDE